VKSAWTILIISALTDFFITAGTAYMAMPNDATITNRVIITILIGGLIAAARTIQQALKATPETAAALKGDVSVVTTKTIEKTP